MEEEEDKNEGEMTCHKRSSDNEGKAPEAPSHRDELPQGSPPHELLQETLQVTEGQGVAEDPNSASVSMMSMEPILKDLGMPTNSQDNMGLHALSDAGRLD